MFYNTINLEGEELKQAVSQSMSQEEAILKSFSEIRCSASPSSVYRYMIRKGYIHKRTPLVSIRRAMTDLCKDQKLRKTGRMVPGMYGKPEHTWELL